MSVHHVEHVMGTTVSIDLVDSHDRSLIDEIVAWLHEVDEVFSPYRPDSIISRIGRGEVAPTDAGVPHDVLEVLQRCGELAEATGGAFDVWSQPAPNGTRFDPCGYVKGWAVQRAARLVQSRGVLDFCINAGGDVALGGYDHDGQSWKVGVRNPFDPHSLALVLHEVGPAAVATSGTYERGPHIIDPRTGRAATELVSATVVGPDLAEADAFATTVFVMGVAGLHWLAQQPGYSGCVITDSGELMTTEAFNRHRAA